MVAYDELGSLVPTKRTLQVIDYQNQANKESEVRYSRVDEEQINCLLFVLALVLLIVIRTETCCFFVLNHI